MPPGSDTITVTLWEYPSGRELSAVLGIDAHLEGHTPREGQRIRVWTWMEYPGGGKRRPRVLVELDDDGSEAPGDGGDEG